MPSYASTSFGEDCLPCHQSGITVLTNATDTIQVEANASFWLGLDNSTRVKDHKAAYAWFDVAASQKGLRFVFVSEAKKMRDIHEQETSKSNH